MSHQNWNDIVTRFSTAQVRILNTFTILATTYSQSDREKIAYLIQENADEMEHHGYDSRPYHQNLSKGLQTLMKLSPSATEAFMMSYQLATPSVRTQLKEDIKTKETFSLPDESLWKASKNLLMRRILKNALNQFSTKIPVLGEQILWEQLQPSGRLNQSDLNTNHPLRSILFRVAQLPPAKRNQAAQIFSNSRQVVAQSDINKGVSYLATQLLPILMPDHPVTRSSHLKTRAEKTKQMHADLKVFGWFLLTQNPYDQKMWVEQIEIKHQNQLSKRMLKDCMDYCYCCY